MTRNLKHHPQLLALFFTLICVSSFNGFSQTISIGSPVNTTEGAGSPVSFLISLDNGAINTTGSDITGTITLGGSATQGTDFMGPSSFAIANGSNSIGVLMPIIDDAFCEPTETITATISNVSSGSVNPANSQSSADIFDDDCASQYIISIGNPVDALEGSSDITFDIFIENGLLNSTGSSITGTIDYPSGSAAVNNDYIPVNNFLIPDGANSTTITIPVLDDALMESTETVMPILTGSPSVGSYGNTTSTANIYDDEVANALISIGSPVDGAEGGSDVSFTVFIEGGQVNNTGVPINGSISYSGSATLLSDYNAQLNFSIPDGESTDTIVASVINDLLLECNEDLIATISNPNIGTIGTASATAFIIDDEWGQTTISIVSPTDGEEGGADVTFVITLDGGVVNGTGTDISGGVSYAGTATAGSDYVDLSGFSIPDGASFTTLSLPVVDDSNNECDETVIATISNPTYATIGIPTDSAIIIDDDCTVSIDVLTKNELKIYPNPASSAMNFESATQMSSYTIIDLNGRILSVGEISAKEFSLNVEFLSAGTYIIDLTFEDGTRLNSKILRE